MKIISIHNKKNTNKNRQAVTNTQINHNFTKNSDLFHYIFGENGTNIPLFNQKPKHKILSKDHYSFIKIAMVYVFVTTCL